MKKTKSIFRAVLLIVLSFALIFVVVGLRVGLFSKPTASGSPVIPARTSPSADPVPEETPEPTPEPIEYTISITEAMPSNKSTLADVSGQFPDWLELYNTGSEDLDLSGCVLSCGGRKAVLSESVISAGSYAVVFCSDSEPVENSILVDLSLPRDGGEITLYSPENELLDSLCYEAVAVSDTSVFRTEDGSCKITEWPTPGFPNTAQGYADYQSSCINSSALVINEVLVYNPSYLKKDNEFYDLVELKNCSSSPISLGSWYLSDKGSNRALYRLPDVSLQPGDVYVIYCTGDASLAAESPDCAPFALSAQEDHLYLSYEDGSLADYVHLKNIPYCGSIGRLDGQNGFFLFSSPTPGSTNGGTCARSVAEKPVLSGEPDGVYNDVDSVTVSLSSDGEIHYTLDGSRPSAASPLYTSPITLNATSVVRAVSVKSGCFDSESLDLSYIINENHSLPVVSLVMDPADFTGFYNNPTVEIEKPATACYYKDDTSFELECGVKLHGATSKIAQKKKSLKLCFRSRYDGELQFNLFDNGVTEFSSVILRAAQEDVYSTLIRDNLIHQLAKEAFPYLSIQDSQYAVLYINGEYRGLYNIREAHSADHYANHNETEPENIVQWKSSWDTEIMGSVYRAAVSTDLNNQDNFDAVAAHLDLNSIIAWSIMEAYSGNFDCHPPNMRFYYNTETEVMAYALVDLDLGFFEDRYFSTPFDFGYAYNTLAKQLLNNPGYREEFLRQLGAALTTTLSDEHVNAKIDELAETIRPEIERDRNRWGSTLLKWEWMVEDLHKYVNHDGGRAYRLYSMLYQYINVTSTQKESYFSDIKRS